MLDGDKGEKKLRKNKSYTHTHTMAMFPTLVKTNDSMRVVAYQ